jgi:hypothetical protein
MAMVPVQVEVFLSRTVNARSKQAAQQAASFLRIGSGPNSQTGLDCEILTESEWSELVNSFCKHGRYVRMLVASFCKHACRAHASIMGKCVSACTRKSHSLLALTTRL